MTNFYPQKPNLLGFCGYFSKVSHPWFAPTEVDCHSAQIAHIAWGKSGIRDKSHGYCSHDIVFVSPFQCHGGGCSGEEVLSNLWSVGWEYSGCVGVGARSSYTARILEVTDKLDKKNVWATICLYLK